MLSDFLSRGELGHFFADEEAPSDEPTLSHMVDPAVLRVISPKFAAQFSDVFTRAIERGDVDSVHCLLGGRRWVLPEQEELCFEGPKRALMRLCEPLAELVQATETRSVGLKEVERALLKGNLNDILEWLPDEFHEVHASLDGVLRSLSIAYYNRESDAEQAKAIRSLGAVWAFQSRAISHQRDEDVQQLEEFILEERAKEAHLLVRGNKLDITRTGASFQGKSVAPEEIWGARWGATWESGSPPTLRFRFALTTRLDTAIDADWSVSRDFDEHKAHWGQLISATTEFLLEDLLARFRQRLSERGVETVGPLEVTHSGIIFEVKGWFSTSRVAALWRNLASKLEDGVVHIHDVTNPKLRASLNLAEATNAFVLHLLCSNKDLQPQ